MSRGNDLAPSLIPTPIRQPPEGVAVRASWGQQGLWFVDQLDIPPAAYAMSIVLELRGTLEPVHLRRALATVVARHAALRTTLHRGADGTLCQRIGTQTDVPIARVALAASDRWHDAVRRFLDEPFDLERDLMLRARLFASGPGGSDVLVLCVHHIAADARSLAIVLRDVSQIYRALLCGDVVPPAPPSAQYNDFAAWQHRRIDAGELSAQLTYWREQLAGHPAELPLPTKGPRPAMPSLVGRTRRRTLSPALGAALAALCPVHRVSLFMVLLTAFKVLLYRYSGQGDVVVGTPAANRTSPEWQDVVGYFVNTLVLRTDLGDAPTLAEALRRVRATALAAYGNQELPFELLVRELQPARDPSRNPLFQIMFSYLEEDGSPLLLGDTEAIRRHDVDGRASPFDLTLLVRRRGESLELFATYATDLYDEAFIEGLLGAYEVLLDSLPVSADRAVSQLPILGESEYHTLVHGWNDTDVDVDLDADLYGLFAAQVERAPDAVALLHGKDSCTYRRLQARAGDIARHLGDLGVSAGDIVAISLERSIDLVAGVLGVLACEATWLPIDPAYPEERRRYMLSDARAKALLTLSTQRAAVTVPDCTTVFVDGIDASGKALRARRARGDTQARPPAYLIYTSGSTGLPKGVLGTHAGTLNRCAWMWRTLPFVDGDTSCIKTASSFVDSVWEMFGPLLKGVPAVIVPQETLLDSRAFVSLLQAHRITSLVVVPSLLEHLVEELRTSGAELPMLRLCISSGEALPATLAERFLTALPAARLLNLYGSSEVSADVTCYEPRRPCGTGIVPIGRPIANTRALVFDEAGNPVPVGVPGELYIGGVNVAAGYHERPELDASRFVESRHAPGRLFRTGDIVRWNTLGVLEFVGRRDNQFKIRGHRADTAEIEHAAAACPGVGQALAQVAGDGVDVRIRLFVVPADGSIVERDALQQHLRRALPRHLLPAGLWILDALPLTPNGKTDGAALTAHAASDETGTDENEDGRQGPATPLEAELTRIWSEVLERTSIGVEENFFDIGGHSLLAVRLFNEIERSVQRRLPLTLIYELATIRELARYLESDADVEAAPTRALMTLRREQHADALFLLPPAGGTGMYYAKLVDMLPRGFDIYSFDSIDSPSFDSLESLAAHYIEEMDTVRHFGPWFLLGSCFGNHLAFEMSRQLEARGNTRIHLMLVDSSPPHSGPGWQTSFGPQRPDGLSRGAHYARLLLTHYRAGTVHLLRDSMVVRARWWTVGRLRHYWKARRHQVSLIARYSASTGSASMRLYLSEEMSRRPQIVERWRALTNSDFGCDVLPIRRHADLARPNSLHWQMIATHLAAYLDGLHDDGQDRSGD